MTKPSHLTPAHQRSAGYGRARNIKARQRVYPARIHFNLREACRKARLRVRACECEFYNPIATGKRDRSAGAPQWIDVVATHPQLGILAIDLLEPDPRVRKYHNEKQETLTRRGIPYLVCTGRALNDLRAEIIVWIMKLENERI